MTMLIFYISLSLFVSFICSVLEAVILSVTPNYLESLKHTDEKLFNEVSSIKSDPEKPLASILTFNTIAHTIGAAGAGAEAQAQFGSSALTIFSALLTFAILFFSEIIPKSIGANMWQTLLPLSGKVLKPMIFLSFPVVWLSEKVSLLFDKQEVIISKEEIRATTDIGLSQGVLSETEHRAISEIVQFKSLKIKDVMTPYSKVFSLPFNINVNEARERIKSNTHSRIPVLGVNNDDIKGFILRVKILEESIENPEAIIYDLSNPMLILPQNTNLASVFHRLLDRREHIAAAIDDNGQVVGIITLEDVVEHMIGFEIYDEQDYIVTKK